jgi:hypothetical protein
MLLSLQYQSKKNNIKLKIKKTHNMKNVLILLVAFLTSFSVLANDVNFDLITDLTNKTITLDLKKNAGTNVSVQIVDLDGAVVFNEQFKANKKSRKYNLSNLAIGTYDLIIEDESSITTKKVYISKASLLVDEKAEIIKKPTIISNTNNWIVKNNSDIVIDFSISDDKTVLTKQTLVPGGLDKKIFTDNIERGIYTLTYTINGRDYYVNVTK